MRIKVKDKVIVLSGKDKGKVGNILKVFTKQDKVLVEKINIVKKSVKATNKEENGGIIEKEMPIKASKIMLVCSKCNNPTRIKKDILSDGKKVRICKKCGEIII
ncbi:MAG: 50S ribosomal protein L24 [Elusimicrobiota bacterium]|jgi:large subunit ribosomal protein L24|nr:50S ribosomal protein L24 [Elusimicrobiota bacterium]